MTEVEFRQRIKQEYKLADITNYVTASAIIILGVYFLAESLADGIWRTNSTGALLIILMSLCLFGSGAYILWRIPKDYLVRSIHSTKPSIEKLEAVERYFTDVKLLLNQVNGNIRHYQYQNRFFNRVNVYVYISVRLILCSMFKEEIILV